MIADIILKVAAMERTEEDAYRPRPSSAGPQRCIRQMVYHGLGISLTWLNLPSTTKQTRRGILDAMERVKDLICRMEA